MFRKVRFIVYIRVYFTRSIFCARFHMVVDFAIENLCFLLDFRSRTPPTYIFEPLLHKRMLGAFQKPSINQNHPITFPKVTLCLNSMHSLDALSQYPNKDFPENRTEGQGSISIKEHRIFIWSGEPSSRFYRTLLSRSPRWNHARNHSPFVSHFLSLLFGAIFCRHFSQHFLRIWWQMKLFRFWRALMNIIWLRWVFKLLLAITPLFWLVETASLWAVTWILFSFIVIQHPR